jgi:ribosome-associated protein
MADRSDRALAITRRVLDARKAEDVVVLDLRERSVFTDFFVICHGTSERQVKSLADEITQDVKKETGLRPSLEGYNKAEWVLLDFGDFVVHIFSKAARDFYRLESLWYDAPALDN